MPSHTTNHGADPEIDNLRAMLQGYAEVIGSDNTIMPIGDAGYVVRFSDRPVNRGGDWVVYDLDDTIIGYSEAKTVRLEHYIQYLKKHKINLGDADAYTLVETADLLSRWNTQGRKMYHVDAHITLLAWATELVSRLDSDGRGRWISTFKDQAEHLAVEKPNRTPEDMPFVYSDKQLVFKKQIPGIDRIYDLFSEVFDAMVRPERNKDMLDTIMQLGTDSQGGDYQINQGILTYGTPDFQLHKTLELMKDLREQGIDSHIASILLARVKKGAFLEELLALDPYTNAEAPYSEVADDLFNDIPHAILLVDDDPVELESFVSNNGKYTEFRYDLDLLGIRYQRAGTKNFEVTGTYGEHEHRVGHHKASEQGRELRHAIYELLETQVIPPPNSPAGREERWRAGAAKKAFYKQMAAGRHADNHTQTASAQANVAHREAEYLAGQRLPFDPPGLDSAI